MHSLRLADSERAANIGLEPHIFMFMSVDHASVTLGSMNPKHKKKPKKKPQQQQKVAVVGGWWASHSLLFMGRGCDGVANITKAFFLSFFLFVFHSN